MKQHSNHFLDLVTEAKKHIKEISAETLHGMLESGKVFHLVDVREEEELPSGCIPNAIHISKGVIERDIEKSISDLNAEIVVYCSGGFRSALVAQNLQTMGYQNVASLNDGLRNWVENGFPLAPLAT
ncbi:MAG: rhodanese-like domain-containing protein [Gammaproteobacteria bacterium]|nr:sulfurtransferase [Gammaproteobacteria bacterium]